MDTCREQYEQVCKAEFAEVNAKLDRLDEAIRGNGKVGIQRRLDRLESAEASRDRLIWIIVGSAVTLAVSNVWQKIFGG